MNEIAASWPADAIPLVPNEVLDCGDMGLDEVRRVLECDEVSA